MKLTCLVVAAVLATAAFGQKLELKFEDIAAKASGKSEIDLDTGLLKLLLKMSGEADSMGWLGGVKSLRVRSYTFDKKGAYSDKDLDALRKQVNAQAKFARVVTQKEDDESTEIWVAADGDKLGACLIIAAEARELSVVYLEGSMSLTEIKGMIERHGAHDLIRLAEK